MDRPNAQTNIRILNDVFEQIAVRGKQVAAIGFREGQTVEITGEDLSAEVDALANGLRHRGIAPGDRAAVCGAASMDWIVCALAILRAGGVVVPLDAQMDDDNLAHVLRDSAPTFLFTDADHQLRLDDLDLSDRSDTSDSSAPPTVVLLHAPDHDRHWRNLRKDNAPPGDWPERTPDDSAVLFYTSGTTGAPKGVPLTHANLAFQIRTVIETEIATARDRLLLALPLHHVYPFVLGMLAPLAVGAPIVLPEALTGPRLLHAVREGRATVMIGVPRLYRALVEGIHERFRAQGRLAARYVAVAEALGTFLRRRLSLFAGRLLLRPLHRRIGPHLRLMASGGSLLDPELGHRLEGMGWRVAIGYGLTETSPLLTLRLPGQGPLESVGRPIQGVELRIDATPTHEQPKEPSNAPNDGRAAANDANEVSNDAAALSAVARSAKVEGRNDASAPSAVAGTAKAEASNEILARGPGVFHGYRNRDDETREVLDDGGWFHTGDMGYLDDDGYLHITGRVSTLIVTEGGENVQPDTVERAYEAHPLISEIGILEQDRKLAALVVPDLPALRRQETDDAQAAVRAALNEQARDLPSYMQVAAVRTTREALPRTRLGKIRRHLLAQRYEDAGEEQSRAAGPPMAVDEMSDRDRALLENDTARRVWDWLCERFPDHGLTPDTAPGMDLDVDSMAWLNLTLEIRERTGVELSEEAIGRVETIRDLLQEAVDASSHHGSRADPVDAPYDVLSEEQQRWLQPLGPVMHAIGIITYWTVSALFRAMYRVRTNGLENVPETGPCVLTPNHTSYLDPFVLGHVLGPGSMSHTYWAGLTTAAFDTAAKRFGCRIGRGLPINPQQGAAGGLAFAAAVLKRKQRLVWFPEGGRSPDGTLHEFKPGLGKVLAALPVPVVPVYIAGAYAAWPIHQPRPRPGTLTVTFGEPIPADEIRAAATGDDPERRIVELLRQRVAGLRQ